MSISEATARRHHLKKKTGSRFSRSAGMLVENLESRILFSSAAMPLLQPPLNNNAAGPSQSIFLTPKIGLNGPTNLINTVLGATSVKLDWTNNDPTASGFWVFRSTDGVSFAQVAKIGSPQLSTFTDTTVAPFRTYFYKVHVYTAAVTSSPSNTVTAVTPLGTPTSLAITIKSPTSLQINWANSDASAAGYNVLRSTDGVNFSQLATVNNGLTKVYVDTTNSSDTAYWYKVQAINGTSSSSLSTAATATTPLIAPSGVTLTALSGTNIKIDWTNNDLNTAGYTLLRSTDGLNFAQIANIAGGGTTTYNDTTVFGGRTYYYQLKAYNGAIASALTTKVSASTPLVAPSNLATTVNSATSVKLTWTNNDPYPAGYQILRSLDGVNFTAIGSAAGVNTATYTDTTALPFKNYWYMVKAYNGAIFSAASASATASTPLATPTGLTATVKSNTTIQLAWTNTDASSLGYFVQRSTDGVNFSTITTINSGATKSYLDTVSSVTSYQYRVISFNGGSSSPNSNTATATTPLGAASGLTATLNGTAINLAWLNNDANTAGYKVLRSVDGAAYGLLTTIANPVTLSFNDSTVATGHTYAYQIQAYQANVSAPVTAAASVTIPLVAPTSLLTTVNSATSITLNWTNNDPSATGYWLFRSTDGVTFTQLAKVASAATTYTDATLSPLKKYYYKVHVYNTRVTSSPSNTVNATTPLATPTSLAVYSKSSSNIQINWANTDAAALGYYVMRSTNGVNFSQIATIGSGAIKTYNDTTVSSNTNYTYKICSYNGTNTSAMTGTVSGLTMLTAPSGVTVTAQSGSVIALSWTNNDAGATGFAILRSTDGVNFSALTTISNPAQTTYNDTGLLSGRTYYYQVKATTANNASALTAKVSTNTPIAAPSNLATTVLGPISVKLTWTGNDANAAGYYVYRSTNGGAYVKVATIASVATLTYTDAPASGTSFNYQIAAYYGAVTSAASTAASAITPLVAPASAAVTTVGGWLKVTWTAKDAAATGYTIMRSTDGVNFSQQGTVASANTSYIDSTVAANTLYYYKVMATNAATSSGYSNTASATPPIVDPTGNVTIATRYGGSELVITALGTNDSISVTQSGAVLTIIADGQSFTQSVPSAGLFIYARGGADTISIGASVTLRTTIAAIDNAATIITSAGSNVSIWADFTDSFSGTGTLHGVSAYAGNVSKALGMSLANPSDSGALTTATGSLWGTGPLAADINQGSVGDCYFLASIAGFANTLPARLIESAVDMGDGTYVVQYFKNGAANYIRVSAAMPAGGWAGYKFQHPGASGNIWGLVMEKAFAYFRTGANTYASISSGWMGEVYNNLNVSWSSPTPQSFNDTNLFNTINNALNNGKVVTAATQNGTQLVPGHAYTVISASRDAQGVARYIVRNPWGVSGNASENSQGYANLTYAQMLQAFGWLCVAG